MQGKPSIAKVIGGEEEKKKADEPKARRGLRDTTKNAGSEKLAYTTCSQSQHEGRNKRRGENKKKKRERE